MERIDEVKRSQLVSQSRRNPRFRRRLRCHLPTGSGAYDNVDTDRLFKEDVLETVIEVKGETDNYKVIVSFTGVIENLKKRIAERGKLDLNAVMRSISDAFTKNDVYIHCSCPDFKYRFRYWATIDHYNAGEYEMRPTKITNPNGDLGSCCKHGLLILNKQSWIINTASVINNYIRMMRIRNPRLYSKIIEPVLFGEKEVEAPENPVADNQISIFDDDFEANQNNAETNDEPNTENNNGEADDENTETET